MRTVIEILILVTCQNFRKRAFEELESPKFIKKVGSLTAPYFLLSTRFRKYFDKLWLLKGYRNRKKILKGV